MSYFENQIYLLKGVLQFRLINYALENSKNGIHAF